MTTRLADQTPLDRLQQLSSSTPRSVPLPVTGYEHHLHATAPTSLSRVDGCAYPCLATGRYQAAIDLHPLRQALLNCYFQPTEDETGTSQCVARASLSAARES